MEVISELSNPAFNPNTIVVYPEGMNVQAPGVSYPNRYFSSRSTINGSDHMV
jgi:hypothetical protein